MRGIGLTPLDSTNGGDIDIYFDNIGRYIIKTYRVNCEKSLRSNNFTTTGK